LRNRSTILFTNHEKRTTQASLLQPSPSGVVVSREQDGRTMTSLSTRAFLGAGAAALAVVGALTLAPTPVALVFAATLLAAAFAYVASAAQLRHLQDEQRLVYRPVRVRRQHVQQRVTFRDE
jgi:hypothetical protein